MGLHVSENRPYKRTERRTACSLTLLISLIDDLMTGAIAETKHTKAFGSEALRRLEMSQGLSEARH